MYFNVYLYNDTQSNYVCNFDYIDIKKNIEISVLKSEINEIERRFMSEYDSTRYVLCIMDYDPGLEGGK